jgi:hypothetical protein
MIDSESEPMQSIANFITIDGQLREIAAHGLQCRRANRNRNAANYSYRSANIGSTRVARSAGT